MLFTSRYSNPCTIICIIISFCILYCDAQQCGNCTSPTSYCNTATMTCVQCLEDTNCTAFGSNKTRCQDFKCVDCISSSDCKAPTLPYCNNKNQCTECLEDSNCLNADKPYCNTTSGICVACTNSNQCSGNYCLQGTCVQCSRDSHCQTDQSCDSLCQNNLCTLGTLNCSRFDANLYCNKPTQQCVECRNSSDCSNSVHGQICSENRCVECIEDANCTSGQLCSNFSCVQCAIDADCRDSHHCDSVCNGGFCEYGNLTCPICNVDSGTCECYSDSSCNDPATPHCNTDTFQCVECTGDLQCSDSPKGPYCFNFTCVGCAANWQCRNKTNCNSLCLNNQCHYGNLSCPFECNPNNGTCVCMNDTQCLNPKRPFCDLQKNPRSCVQCYLNSHCKDPMAPYCSLSTRTCVQCVNDTQCRSDQSCDSTCVSNVCNYGPTNCSYCHKESGSCGCSSNLECGESRPYCDDFSHVCKECQTHSDCLDSSKGKFCAAGTCVQCIDSVNCEATQGCVTTCANNKCQVENCTTNSTCVNPSDCQKTKPLCVNNTCAECITVIDCGPPETNCLYSCTNSTCIKTCACEGSNCSCTQDSECMMRDLSTPLCKKTPTSSMCVQCYNDTHCNETLDVCDTNLNLCVQCTNDFQCNSGEFCFLNYGKCVECFSNDHCNETEINQICVNFECVVPMNTSTTTTGNGSVTIGGSGETTTGSVVSTGDPGKSMAPQFSSKQVGGIIAGSVIGGIIMILAILLTIFLILRKSHGWTFSTGDVESKPAKREISGIYTSKNNSAEGAVFQKESVYIRDIIIDRPLGTGRFGYVYIGKWNETTDVAVKKLKHGNPREFENELNVLMKLNHPHIVRFLGIYIQDTEYYLVMEYLAKGCLSDFLRLQDTRMKLTQKDLLKMACDVAAGMMHLEQKNIIHRDLGARNLLVSEADGKYVIKIADFGLSREVQDDLYKASDSTFPVKWSPPEVILLRQFTSKSDVWSYGVCMWEIFELGRVPYGTMSNQESLDFVLNGGRLARPELCTDEVFRLMQQCWQTDHENRPSFKSIYQKFSQMLEIEQLFESANTPANNLNRNSNRNSVPTSPGQRRDVYNN